MSMKFLSVCILILLTQGLLGQNKLIDISGHADCKSMKTIQLRPLVGPMSAPTGYGEILEFSDNERSDTLYMERENNTVWYKFETKASGELNFELIPLDSLNDYDFMLYKYTDENFCDAVINKTTRAIRTNFSRNKVEEGSRTGLSSKSIHDFVGAGVHPAYSKSLEVKKGDLYVLVVNNVYPNGKGHSLKFSYERTVAKKQVIAKRSNSDLKARGSRPSTLEKLSISGAVIDEESQKAIVATVSVTDAETGELLGETTSDSITGKYKLEIDKTFSLNSSFQLEVFKEEYFF